MSLTSINHNTEYPLIPDEAFLYMPKRAQLHEINNGKQLRIIFDGGVTFTSNENDKLISLKQEMSKKQKNDNLKTYKDNQLLRMLQANQFNNSNTIHALREYKLWQEKQLPSTLTKDVEGLLVIFLLFIAQKQGILYMSGRDYRYRPILVVNVGLILKLAPKQDIFFATLAYFFNFIIQNCLIEGQVENWVSIIDLGNAGAFSLGGTLADTIKYLSSNFRSRVHKSYLINAPSSIKWVWGMVKNALSQDQLKKLSLTGKTQLDGGDFLQINKSQVEQKYGGSRRDIVKYWPLMPCEQTFSTAKSSQFALISIEEYSKKHQKGEFSKRKINKKYIAIDSHKLIIGSGETYKQNISKSISEQDDQTRSQLQQELQQINRRIPKQQRPQPIPLIPEEGSLNHILKIIYSKIML